MEKRAILVLLGLLVMPFATAEEAYVWTDEDGVVHYSDRPVPGARRIELAEPNTSRSPAPSPSTILAASSQEWPASVSPAMSTHIVPSRRTTMRS